MVMLEDAREDYFDPPAYTCHCCTGETVPRTDRPCRICSRNANADKKDPMYKDWYQMKPERTISEEFWGDDEPYYGPGCHPLEDKIEGNFKTLVGVPIALPDSGQRTNFGTGAVRETEAKGRCDLMPWDIIGRFVEPTIICGGFCDNMYNATHNVDFEYSITQCLLEMISLAYENSFESAMLDVAHHYEDGAKKYADRNWEKGIPVNVFLSAAGRHFLKFQRGDVDERHDRAVVWNLLGALWMTKHHPELI